MSGRIFKDTSNIFAIDYGDIVQIGGKEYLIKGHEREDRFGLDEPKFWVKKAVDMETGERKILKLSFFETFEATVGALKIPCFRHPEKEGAILELVKDHPYFMHGDQHIDSKGNNVRVLDIVKGVNFYRYIESIHMDHERYFYDVLPGILKKLVKAFEALQFLHKSGFRHGDVRNDHIIIEEGTDNYVWIDFDYDYDLAENPFSLDIIGIGNILLYSIGKGFHNLKDRDQGELIYKNLLEKVDDDDFSIIHNWRFMNLKKLYPYIPDDLNDILRHFTFGASIFYESADEVLEDLKNALPQVNNKNILSQ